MTAQRQPKANAFGAAIGTAATSRRRSVAPAPTGGAQRKYTLLLDEDVADSFDQNLLNLRRQVGRKVDKSHVVRELLALLDEDPALATQVAERLRLR